MGSSACWCSSVRDTENRYEAAKRGASDRERFIWNVAHGRVRREVERAAVPAVGMIKDVVIEQGGAE